MSKISKLFLIGAFLSVSTLAYAVDETLKADRDAVNAACASESATAGCGSDKVGTGLLKCIFAYKKANRKAFKISDGCKEAMKKLHTDKQAKK